jgi:hypothetical protein
LSNDLSGDEFDPIILVDVGFRHRVVSVALEAYGGAK